jgi:DnaJ family protein C protein 13
MVSQATLMQPMHDHFDLGQEQRNKTSLLGSKAFLEKLAGLLKHHVGDVPIVRADT